MVSLPSEAPPTIPITPTTPTIPSTPPTIINPLPPSGLSKEDELTYFVHDFESTYSKIVSMPYEFRPASYFNSGNPSLTVIGVCEIYSNGYTQLLMNQDWWPSGSLLQKKVLVFHELGHCVFRRKHDTRFFDSTSRAKSIMYPNLDAIMPHYPTYTAYYLDELEYPIPAIPETDLLQFSLSSDPIVYKTYDNGHCE